MWSIFYNEQIQIHQVINNIESWRDEIFSIKQREVKDYFAQKFTLYFDNMMIFFPKKGVYLNMMESMSLVEKEYDAMKELFPPIKAYWLKESEGNALITFGLEEKLFDTAKNHYFKLLQSDAIPMNGEIEKMEHYAMSSLFFHINLIDYKKNWMDYLPPSQERCEQQVRFILRNMHYKKEDLSLIEKINFEENIEQHPQYQELFEKILRVMPKIESALQQEVLKQHNKNSKKEMNHESKTNK